MLNLLRVWKRRGLEVDFPLGRVGKSCSFEVGKSGSRKSEVGRQSVARSGSVALTPSPQSTLRLQNFKTPPTGRLTSLLLISTIVNFLPDSRPLSPDPRLPIPVSQSPFLHCSSTSDFNNQQSSLVNRLSKWHLYFFAFSFQLSAFPISNFNFTKRTPRLPDCSNTFWAKNKTIGECLIGRYNTTMSTITELERKVMQLPEDQRVALVHRVLEVSESSKESEIQGLWNDEITRRIDRLDKGLTQRIPVSEVFRELDQRLA